MKYQKGDKVVVHGLDLAFVVDHYLTNNVVRLYIEGESASTTHSVVSAREDVLLPNDTKTMLAEERLRKEGPRRIVTPEEKFLRIGGSLLGGAALGGAIGGAIGFPTAGAILGGIFGFTLSVSNVL